MRSPACSPSSRACATSRFRPSELEQARKYLLGSYEISLQTNTAQGDELAFNELYGLGIDGGDRYREALGRVTPAAVQAAARGYLTLNAYTLAIVGPRSRPAKRG